MVQTFVPLWMAPNLITLLGLIFPLISLGIFAWHSPHFKTEPPAWTFFFNAFALFAYQTLDNMDGKQARRTQSSNALGMVFDHGCDAINAGIGAINLLVVLGIVSSGEWDAFLVLSAFASPFVPFYVATWEEYYTGALVLPIINGPAEGVLMGVFISLVSGFLGPAWWGRENEFLLALDWLPLKRPGDLIGWFSLMGVIVTCIWQISNVLFLQFQKGRSLLPPLQDLLPFVFLSGGTYLLVSRKHEFLTEAPLLTMGAVSSIFVEQVVSLMLAHMTHSPYVPHHRTLLPPFLGFVGLATFESLAPVKEGLDAVEGRLFWWWQGHFVIVFGYTFLYLVLVVADLSRVLGVRPFRIKTAAAAAGGGGGNGGKKQR
jgi:ethanolaminephosphotransferase